MTRPESGAREAMRAFEEAIASVATAYPELEPHIYEFTGFRRKAIIEINDGRCWVVRGDADTGVEGLTFRVTTDGPMTAAEAGLPPEAVASRERSNKKPNIFQWVISKIAQLKDLL